MNPTMELVGTVVSEPEVVAVRRFFGVRLEVETRLDYADVHGDFWDHHDRHEVILPGELARRKQGIRRGDLVNVRGTLRFETTVDPRFETRRATLEAFVVANEIELAGSGVVDRNEAFVLGRYHRVTMLHGRALDESLRFELVPLSLDEIGLEDRSAPTGVLEAYAFGDLAHELEGLGDDAIVAVRGRLATYQRGSDAIPPRCFELAAGRWG